MAADGKGVEVLLQRTPDGKRDKNRVHPALGTRDLEAEIARVTALDAVGAVVLTKEPIVEHGWTWHIPADPDGDEFCVPRPPDAYWADR